MNTEIYQNFASPYRKAWRFWVKFIARILIHVRTIYNCRVSFKMILSMSLTIEKEFLQ